MELATFQPLRQELQNEQIYKCPNCSNKNSGYIEKEASALTLISTVIAILLFKFYSLMILPLIIEASKTCIKKCVKCDHILEKQELLSVPSLTDKVLSFKCGGCAIVISRKYAIVLTIIMIIIYFFLPSSPHAAIVNPGGQILDTKWENYVEDCGRQALLNNGVRAKKNFETKYHANIISWKGSVQSRVDRSRIRDPSVAGALLIKMNPTDAKIEFPDLEIVIGNDVYHRFKDEIEPLTPMDIIEFTGKLRRIGDEFSYHAIEALEIKNTKEKMDWSQLQVIDIAPQQSSLRKSEKGSTLQLKPAEVLAAPAAAAPAP